LFAWADSENTSTSVVSSSHARITRQRNVRECHGDVNRAVGAVGVVLGVGRGAEVGKKGAGRAWEDAHRWSIGGDPTAKAGGCTCSHPWICGSWSSRRTT